MHMALWLVVSNNKSLAHSSVSRFQTTTPMSIRPNVRAVPLSDSTSEGAASLKRVQASWRAESTGPSGRQKHDIASLKKIKEERDERLCGLLLEQEQLLQKDERGELTIPDQVRLDKVNAAINEIQNNVDSF